MSAASLIHLAWALVLARVSGRRDVVFGTVLLGRMQGTEGADRVLGMLMNTLPIRVRVGARGVAREVRELHRLLAELMAHQHAPLTLAQACSGVRPPSPLFTSLLNYRHSTSRVPSASGGDWAEGIHFLWTGGAHQLSVHAVGRRSRRRFRARGADEPSHEPRVCAR